MEQTIKIVGAVVVAASAAAADDDDDDDDDIMGEVSRWWQVAIGSGRQDYGHLNVRSVVRGQLAYTKSQHADETAVTLRR